MEQEYSQNLANGKKNLLCGDFSEAVTCFQNACYVRYGTIYYIGFLVLKILIQLNLAVKCQFSYNILFSFVKS